MTIGYAKISQIQHKNMLIIRKYSKLKYVKIKKCNSKKKPNKKTPPLRELKGIHSVGFL